MSKNRNPLRLAPPERKLILRLRRNKGWLRAMLAGQAGDLVYLPRKAVFEKRGRA